VVEADEIATLLGWELFLIEIASRMTDEWRNGLLLPIRVE